MKIVVVSGGYDPCHAGHIRLFNSAKTYGDYLIVGLNSDAWLERKKGRAFMPFRERAAIVRNLKAVDEIMAFDDSDGTANHLLEKVLEIYGKDHDIIFANGGDRIPDNVPENVKGVHYIYGVGGETKENSSSWILENWKSPKTERPWGYYRVLHEVPGMKVKELTVMPHQELSMQRHHKRAEYWIVSEGMCDVDAIMDSGYKLPSKMLYKHDAYRVPVADWHQLKNPYDDPCRIVEIQYGEECNEDDIERK